MEPRTIEALFIDKFFVIPEYQRDYAWKEKNVSELLDDIKEALGTHGGHYVGTFILSKRQGENEYRVVDGQQRITTLAILVDALIKHLGPGQSNLAIIYTDKFIESQQRRKLRLAGENDTFFRELLKDAHPQPTTRGQRRLCDAHAYIGQQVRELVSTEGVGVLEVWLDGVRTLQVLEFVEADEGRAIRIFETVNDRGVALANIDKAKSVLVYYSNRIVEGRLDTTVNQSVGDVFRAYDAIKDIAEDDRYAINLIKQKDFNEDTILRWHFLASQNDEYNFNATESYALDALRRKLRSERDNKESLAGFVESYAQDLEGFFATVHSLLKRAAHEPKYYKLFCMLGPSTWLYPLLARLHMRNLLDEPVPNNSNLTFLDLIEITDVRVYKARGTDPKRDICFLARDAMGLTPFEISRRLLDFVRRFMDDAEFKRQLHGDVYKSTLAGALRFIFVSWDEHLLAQDGQHSYDRNTLINFQGSEPTIEHVFPENPPFDFPNHGFVSEEDYLDKNHTLGNLLLLEKIINSRGQNRTVQEKLEDLNLYNRSHFRGVQRFRGERHTGKMPIFRGADIETRTEQLADFCLLRWPLWT